MMSIVYVSQSLIEPQDRTQVLDDILTRATDYNSALGISGVLIASPNHFAQLIEGPIAGVEALMSKITADPRHMALQVVRNGQIKQKRCPHWRMARFDRGNFGDSIIDPLLLAAHAGNKGQGSGRLDSLIEIVLHISPPKVASR